LSFVSKRIIVESRGRQQLNIQPLRPYQETLDLNANLW